MKNTEIIESFLKEVEIRLEVKCKKFLPPSEMTYHELSQAYEMIRQEYIFDVMTDVLDEMKVREEMETETYRETRTRNLGLGAYYKNVPLLPPPPPTHVDTERF
jgi:hypothetical protein